MLDNLPLRPLAVPASREKVARHTRGQEDYRRRPRAGGQSGSLVDPQARDLGGSDLPIIRVLWGLSGPVVLLAAAPL